MKSVGLFATGVQKRANQTSKTSAMLTVREISRPQASRMRSAVFIRTFARPERMRSSCWRLTPASRASAAGLMPFARMNVSSRVRSVTRVT